MTQHDEDQRPDGEDAAAPDKAGPAEDAAPEETGPAPEPRSEPPRAGGRGLAMLALLLALLAAAGSGWMYWQQQQASRGNETAALIAAQDERLDELAEQLRALSTENRDLADDLRRIGEEQAGLAGSLGELPERVERLDRALGELPGIGAQDERAWRLAEAEHYLEIANAQLDFAGNTSVAAAALRTADERLRGLGDPRYRPVRELLADEITALEGTATPDIEGIVLRLGAVARSLDGLTPRREAPAAYDSRGDADAGEATGMDRAWQVVGNAFSKLVSVKRDVEITPLLTAEQEALLTRNLSVELQLARLALIRGESELYRKSLAAVRERLQQHFDTGAADVAAALDTLTELENVELAGELPDISGSLSLLRQLASGNDA